MSDLTAEEFAQRVFDVDLLDEHELRSIWADFGTTNITADQFQQLLLGRGLLTSYQVDRLVRDERTGFFYGDYKVLYQIGSGAFARAYRAAHIGTSQVVALKVLRRRYAGDPKTTGLFCREGAIGCMLRHPNIVPIYEVVSKTNTHFLVMEFLEGRTLREFIKVRGQFDPPEALRLMCDIAAGLSYAAERGVTHRDLKTSNILITSRGTAKLVDFGLAAIERSLVDEAAEDDLIDFDISNPRTIDYVGLERLSGVRRDDPRSDIFFAGCILYHMLCGKPALHETTDRLQRLRAERYTEIVPIAKVDPSIPRWITRIVDRAMQLDALARYQRPAEMLHDLSFALARCDNENETKDPHQSSHTSPTNDQAARSEKVIMVVESQAVMQDVFRQAFRDSGYQVMVISDPARAISFFEDDAHAAHCVLFCSSDLGQPALDAFNRFASARQTEDIPAVLLLGKDQADWKPKAQQADHRLAVAAPMRVRQLRELIARLVPLDE